MCVAEVFRRPKINFEKRPANSLRVAPAKQPMDAGFFKGNDIIPHVVLFDNFDLCSQGTSQEQDSRFSDKDARLLKFIKFDPILDKKVDMRKVNLVVMRPWVTKKVVELVGLEDEVVVEYAMELLEDKSNPVCFIHFFVTRIHTNEHDLSLADPRWEKNADRINWIPHWQGAVTRHVLSFAYTSDSAIRIKTSEFMRSLWDLLISAQDSIGGIPAQFLDAKKEELRQKQETDDRAQDEARKRQENSQRLDEVRARDRAERGNGGPPDRRNSNFDREGGFGGRGRGRGRGRGGGGGPEQNRDSGWRGRGRGGRPGGTGDFTGNDGGYRRRSPSPPPRRSPSRTPPRRGYRGGGRRSPSPRRTPPRSPYGRSRSSSRTPPSSRRPRPPRSPSRSPPPKERHRIPRSRRSPSSEAPPRSATRKRFRSPSYSRSPSPPPRRRRPRTPSRSRSPPPLRGSRRPRPSRSRTRSPPTPRRHRRNVNRSPPPPRGGGGGRTRGTSRRSPGRDRDRDRRRRRHSPSPSPMRSRSRSATPPRHRPSRRSRSSSRTRSAASKMDVDEPPAPAKDKPKGMSILGASKWAKQDAGTTSRIPEKQVNGNDDNSNLSRAELDKKENELREKMLRQKVMKTRRKSTSESLPEASHDD